MIAFSSRGWEEYQYWLSHDPKIFKRLQRLIRETLRDPFGGSGKPEPLRNNLRGYWSKRITREHRLVYKVENNMLVIISCRYHYDK